MRVKEEILTTREQKEMSKSLRGIFCINFQIPQFVMLITGLLLIIFFLITSTMTAAAASPHGSFSSSSDKCRNCHRMHTALTTTLLPQSSSLALCTSCHSKGQGADTAVMEGICIESQNPEQSGGQDNEILLGGGFLMVGLERTTGKHMSAQNRAPYGSASKVPVTLNCISCHTPHQGPNYRLLRRLPGEAASDIAVDWNGPWDDETQGSRNDPNRSYQAFTEYDFDSAAGIQYFTKNYKDGMASWCTSCHTTYMIRGPQSYDAGDAYGETSRYRHGVDVPITGGTNPVNGLQYDLTTDLPLEDLGADGRTDDDQLTCLSCHRAHGTDATMTGEAVFPAGERGSLPSGKDSMLLRQDDRIMCIECHRVL